MLSVGNKSDVVINTDKQGPTELQISSLPPELIDRILRYLKFDEWKQSTPHLVCKYWKDNSIDPIKIVRIQQLVIGSDKWIMKLNGRNMLPDSTMPPSMEGNILQYAKKPCPFNPDKLFIETHHIVYIGKETAAMLTNGAWLIFPTAIDAFQKIFQKNTIFCLYNCEAGTTNVEMEAVTEAKWIGLYKEAIWVFRQDGQEMEAGPEEEEKMAIAEKNNYRNPKLVELGLVHFAKSFSTGKKCSTWLSEAKERATICEDTVTVNGVEDTFYVKSDGKGVHTQRRSFDGATSNWNRKATFGLMVCKDLSF